MRIKILSVAMTLIFLFSAADYCCAGGTVKSVENVEIVLADGVFSNSVTLSKNQTIVDCVPFVTQNIVTKDSDCNLDDLFIDVYLQTGPKVIIQRTGNSGAVTAGISVVEFDPDSVKVQSGVYNIASNLTNTTITLAQSADTNKAALVHYSRVWQLTGYNINLVQARFTAGNKVLFERWKKSSAPIAGGATGHYYVFEALGSQFSVQVKNLNWLSEITSTTNIYISAVSTNKTFLIASYKHNTDDEHLAFVRVWLSNNNTITAERNDNRGIIVMTIFAVQFAADGTESVQRGQWDPHDGGIKTAVLPKAVNTDFTMPWNPSLPPGMIEGNNFGRQGAGARQKLKLTGSTAIESSKYPVGSYEKASWEVIEWSEYVIKNGPVILID